MIVDLSRTALLQRVEIAERGQWLMYHVGFLMEDRLKNRRLNSMAHAVYAEYVAGRVRLLQHKLGKWQYEYYAVKR